MSTLRTNTITDAAGANSTTVANLKQGLAKSWFWFDGTGVIALRDSFNIASLTDNGIGDYTTNFTTAFTNNQYAGSVAGDNLVSGFIGFTRDSNALRTTAALRVGLVNSAIAGADGNIQGSVFGDTA